MLRAPRREMIDVDRRGRVRGMLYTKEAFLKWGRGRARALMMVSVDSMPRPKLRRERTTSYFKEMTNPKHKRRPYNTSSARQHAFELVSILRTDLF